MATSSPIAERTITSRLSLVRGNDACVRFLTGILLLGAEELLDFIAGLALREFDVILGSSIVRHEGEKAILTDVELLHGQFAIKLLRVAVVRTS